MWCLDAEEVISSFTVLCSVLFYGVGSTFRFLSLTFGRSSLNGFDKSGHFRDHLCVYGLFWLGYVYDYRFIVFSLTLVAGRGEGLRRLVV